jgi:hypothetical protein
MMDANKTAIERAFELAKSGRLASIDELRRALKSEGYFTHHLTGPSLLGQLRKLIQDSRES